MSSCKFYAVTEIIKVHGHILTISILLECWVTMWRDPDHLGCKTAKFNCNQVEVYYVISLLLLLLTQLLLLLLLLLHLLYAVVGYARAFLCCKRCVFHAQLRCDWLTSLRPHCHIWMLIMQLMDQSWPRFSNHRFCMKHAPKERQKNNKICIWTEAFSKTVFIAWLI